MDTPNHSHSSRDPNSPEDGHSRSTHSGHSSHGHSPDARHGEDSDLDVAVIGRGDSGGSGKDGTHGGGGGGGLTALDVMRTHTVQAAPPPAGKPAASPHRCAGSSPRRVPTATWGPAAPPASGDTRPAQTGVPRGSANRRLAPSSSSREERHVSLGKLKPTGEVDPSGDGNEDDSEDSRDSGEEAGTGRFSMESWKRHFKWNKHKPSELLPVLWKRFNPTTHSIYVVSHRHHDCINATYQGDSLAHGLYCRVEAACLLPTLFGRLHVLYNYDADEYKLIGVFIFRGQALPQQVAEFVDVDCYSWLKMDLGEGVNSGHEAKTLVSELVAGGLPSCEYKAVSTFDFL
ncbi:MAG: hypothetical protein WDW36_006827 [Sanguina aurantia]